MPPSAQQKPGPLGAVQPLVARHGGEGRPQGFKVQGQAAGGLGGVHNQGHFPLPAQGGDLLNRQDKAEDVGHMGAYRQAGALVQLPAEGLQSGPLVKEGASGHPQPHIHGVQGPGHGVVLIAGDYHPAPRTGQGLDGDVQAVGGVEGEHHPLRVPHMEQPGRRFPAGEGPLGRVHGGLMPSPAGAGQVVDGPGGSGGHRGRLLHRGGGTVQIDHSATS